MHKKCWANILWGEGATVRYLIIASVLLLFGMLDSRELWTQEHRWIEIVGTMFYTHDYIHPMLDGLEYYDKPLLSYWFIAGFTFLTGKLNLMALRLPSALAGLIAIAATYSLGCKLKNRSLGLLAAWMLLTTYYFLFWARVGSADMLNLAGALCAVTWYAHKREQASFSDYVVFFLILAVTASCKGLVGPVVAVLAIVPDLFLRRQMVIDRRFFLAMIPAFIVYVTPFLLSMYFSVDGYRQNGLYEVYRENILRYFHPYDHKGPIYTYFLYLPVYMLPWAFFFVPALWSLKKRWAQMSLDAKWMAWATVLLFAFFTLSGSRRSYYVLPMIPYAILMTAEWILSAKEQCFRWAGVTVVTMFVLLASIVLLFQPIYYSHGGVKTFGQKLKAEAEKQSPWKSWKVVLLDSQSKVGFYLDLPPVTKNLDTFGRREKQTIETLLWDWPVLQEQPNDTIIVTREHFVPLLRSTLTNYQLVEVDPRYFEFLTKNKGDDNPVAFIPKRFGVVS